jgi:hypothetical protein
MGFFLLGAAHEVSRVLLSAYCVRGSFARRPLTVKVTVSKGELKKKGLERHRLLRARRLRGAGF